MPFTVVAIALRGSSIHHHLRRTVLIMVVVANYEQITQRVAQGTKELDSRIPHWREKVNSAILDTYSHQDCVLGQVYGSYYVGTLALNLTNEAVIHYGFDAENPADKEEYKKLTSEWKRQLNGSNF